MNGKENVTYMHIPIKEYYSFIRRKENLPHVSTCVDLEGIMVCDINQTEKDKYYVASLAVQLVKNLLKKKYLFTRRKKVLQHVATWINFECIMVLDISQTERQILY